MQLWYSSFQAHLIAEQLKFTFPSSDRLTYINLCTTSFFENKLNSFNTFLSSFSPLVVVVWRFLSSAHADEGEGDRNIAPQEVEQWLSLNNLQKQTQCIESSQLYIFLAFLVVPVVTRLWALCQRNCDSIPGRALSFLQSVNTGSGAHPAFNSVPTVALSLRLKCPGYGAHHTAPSASENEWS